MIQSSPLPALGINERISQIFWMGLKQNVVHICLGIGFRFSSYAITHASVLGFRTQLYIFLQGQNKNAWLVTHFLSLAFSQSQFWLFLMFISCKIVRWFIWYHFHLFCNIFCAACLMLSACQSLSSQVSVPPQPNFGTIIYSH